MKKRMAILFVGTMLCLLTGCGLSITSEVSSIAVDKEGTVEHIIVGELEQPYYDLSELERNVLQILEQHGEVTLEFLCRSLAVSPVDMNGIIMILEMKGYVAVNFGKIFIAKF